MDLNFAALSPACEQFDRKVGFQVFPSVSLYHINTNVHFTAAAAAAVGVMVTAREQIDEKNHTHRHTDTVTLIHG